MALPENELSTELDAERVDLQTRLPYMGMVRGDLTMQQEKLVLLMVSGMSKAAAGRGAGYASPETARVAANLPLVQKALAYYREEMREEVKFTINNAHSMYMEAYSASDTATEMKNTTDSLVKLHALHIPEEKTTFNILINGTKQLERMTDEDLLKIAGKDASYLTPTSN
jgi:hypothetical protein